MTDQRLTAAIGRLIMAIMLAIPAANGLAQSTARKAPSSLTGVWRGTSTCTPESGPACRNEIVVYHLRAIEPRSATHGEHLEWLANKIVNGSEEEMGMLACDYQQDSAVATCPMRGWMWRFTVTGDTLTGTLAEPSGTVWRHVRVVRKAP